MTPIHLTWCEVHDAPRDGPWCLYTHLVKADGNEGSDCLWVDVEIAPLPIEPESWTLTIPLRGGKVAYLELPRRMSEAQWTQMMLVLETMKSGLVTLEELIR